MSSATHQARWMAAAVGAAALASLAFQQSPANEAVRIAAGLWVLDATSSAAAMGLAVAAATIAIDGTTSTLIALGLHSGADVVRRLTDWTHERITSRRPEPTTAGSLATDAILSLGVGAGLVVVRRHVRDPRRSLGTDLLTALASTLFIAAVAGLVGFLAGGGLVYAEELGLGGPARWIVEYGADWRVWAVLILATLGISALRGFIHRRRTPLDQGDPIAPQ